MRLALSPSRRTLLLVVPFLAGCASAGSPPGTYTPADRFLAVQDSIGSGTRVDRGDAPHIRVAVMPSTSSEFVDAAFHVSETAYAFVAVVDLDRRIRVLYPESPADAGLASSGERHPLNRFFAGFGNTSLGSASRYRLASYTTAFRRITPFEGGGVIIAIASERPLQLDRLATRSGDWDEDALEEYLFNTTAATGAYALGRALTVSGQEFTSDIESIARPRSQFAASSFGRGCLDSAFGFDDDFAFGDYPRDWRQNRYVPSRVPIGQFMIGTQKVVRYLETDACGHVTYINIPVFEPGTPRDTTTPTRAVPRSAFRPFAGVDGDATSPWRRAGGQADATPWTRASERPAPRGDAPRIEPRARTREAARPAERRETSPWKETREARPRPEPAPARAPRPVSEPRPTP
jgi:hypothetical protein